ncbi:glycine-rich domain-containing protein [Streptomyces sp. NPDC020983]|uniref:glycine-rich domain-containing protein n=1 Tax=Streptomyces sp. NPDC020983 TaxID=3365106 RepID=UPI0037AB2B2F
MTTILARPTAGALAPVRDPRTFIAADHWDKLVGLLMRDHPFDRVMAERVLGQAIAYLITAMETRGRRLGLAPGKIVDIGVHTMILDTVAYAEFCMKYNDGRFLHHVPLVDMKLDGSVPRTAEQITLHGFLVDESLWAADAKDCGPCHPGNDSH